MLTEKLLLAESQNAFQEKGVLIQMKARNMTQAIRSYNDSCLKCGISHACTGKECAVTKAFCYNAEQYQDEFWIDPGLWTRFSQALELG